MGSVSLGSVFSKVVEIVIYLIGRYGKESYDTQKVK